MPSGNPSVSNRSSVPGRMAIQDLSPKAQTVAKEVLASVKTATPGVITTADVDAYISTFEPAVPINRDAKTHAPVSVDESEIMPGLNSDQFYAAEDAIKLRATVAEGRPYEAPKAETPLDVLVGEALNSTPSSSFNSEGMLKNDAFIFRFLRSFKNLFP